MLRAFEKFWCVVMLIFGTQALGLLIVGPLTDQQRMAPQSDSFALGVNILVHLVASCFYVLHAKTVVRAVSKLPWLFVLVFYAISSTAWSQDPNLSFRRGLILLATTLFGIYFGSRFELPEQVEILGWALLTVLAGSALLAILSPGRGVETGAHLGNWKGLFNQKNTLGRIAVLSLVTFAFWQPRRRTLRYVSLAFALVTLGMSSSSTGLAAAIILAGIIPLFRLIRTNPLFLMPMCGVLASIGVLVWSLLVANADFALALLGRNATLTGRTELWHACMVAIAKRPILGYGFDAFWLGLKGESAIVDTSVHWLAPTAHNGAIDLLLSIGAAGLGLFLLTYLLCLRNSLRFHTSYPGRVRSWPLAYLAFFLIYNITEVTEMEQNSIFMMLFVAILTAVTLHAFQRDKAVAFPDKESSSYEFAPYSSHLPA